MKLHFAPAFRLAAVVVGAAIGSQSAQAGIVASYESPGAQASTRSNITTETFNTIAAGTQVNELNSSIGKYTANGGSAIVIAADQYGGANDGAGLTNYVAVGVQAGNSGEATMTLQLNAPATYFGLWWSAIDAQNELSFYSNGNQVATYNIGTLQAQAGSLAAYLGNPNWAPPLNGSEPYVYVNFDADSGTTFDTIVFTNHGGTGFESDNHSVNAVPEPSALAMGAAASVLGLALARRRGRNA
jgi:hypothetical protein